MAFLCTPRYKLTEPSAPTPFDDGELYDILLGELAYGLEFYTGLAKRAAGPVLDIGCGTGRVMLPCLQSGLDIDGLDISEPMLARLYHADMSEFRLPRRYALIMIPFNSFRHILTQETQIRCLERCREHLLWGGMLVFDGAFPGLHWIGAPEVPSIA